MYVKQKIGPCALAQWVPQRSRGDGRRQRCPSRPLSRLSHFHASEPVASIATTVRYSASIR